MKHLPESFLEPIHFENEHTTEEIDEWRGEVLEGYRRYAEERQQVQAALDSLEAARLAAALQEQLRRQQEEAAWWMF